MEGHGLVSTKELLHCPPLLGRAGATGQLLCALSCCCSLADISPLRSPHSGAEKQVVPQNSRFSHHGCLHAGQGWGSQNRGVSPHQMQWSCLYEGPSRQGLAPNHDLRDSQTPQIQRQPGAQWMVQIMGPTPSSHGKRTESWRVELTCSRSHSW